MNQVEACIQPCNHSDFYSNLLNHFELHQTLVLFYPLAKRMGPKNAFPSISVKTTTFPSLFFPFTRE